VSSSDPFGLVGQVLDGQFRVDRFIGEGGFSVVYAGLHLGLSEPIALKCMKLPAQLSSALVETFVQRFRDESRLHYKLSQGNLHIARTMAAGTTVSPVTHALVPYMVLEWLDGHSMAAELERSHEKRPLAQVIELFETAVDALTFAQEQGVVHRDLNPGNFFLTNTVAGKRLKVLDFGVAKVLDESRLEVGPRVQTVGKIRIFAPAYGAPEQFDDKLGPIGPYTDVYALALVLLETMAGKTVMTGEHLGDFAMAALDPVNRPSPKAVGLSLPSEVEAVFARAFALRPQDRWPKVKDFWAALRLSARLPSARSEDDGGNATMLLATMPLDGARGSSPRESAAAIVEEATIPGELPEEPAPATARLGASHLARQPSSPGIEHPSPRDALAATVALSPSAAPAAPAAPSVVKKGDRSQLVTLAMSVRPSLPGEGRASGVPIAPPPAAGLAATMAMPEAPRRHPLGNERSHTPPERVSYVPPERRTVALAASPPAHPPAQSPPAQPHGYITYPEPRAHDRVSEVPGLPPNVPEANAPPAGVPPAFAADDSAPEPPTSKKALVVVAIAVGVVVVVLLIVFVVTVVRSRNGDTPKPGASTAPSSTAWAIQTTGSSATEAPSSVPTASVAPVVSASAEVAVAPSVPPSPVPTPPPSTPSPQPPPTTPKPNTPPQPPSSPSDPNVFDAAMARTKLDHANGVLVVCKTPDGPNGKGSASVVFAPSGQVTSVGLTVPFEGTKTGACVRGQLLRVKTSPFVGAPQSMAYVFTVPK